MSVRDIVDETLKASSRPGLDTLEAHRWIDVQQPFEDAHFLSGFGHADGKYHFKPDWKSVRFKPGIGPFGPVGDLPAFPDHWRGIEEADAEFPFRLATSPARAFLNSSFNETPSSRKREGRPTVLVHPEDLAALGIANGAKVRLGSDRGVVTLHARSFAGLRRGVLIAESIWPNDAFEDGCGINTLTGADQPAPAGGSPFHDNRVWLKPA